jgi:hypothetical protein
MREAPRAAGYLQIMGRGPQATIAVCIAVVALPPAGAAAARGRTLTFGGTPLSADLRLAGSNGYTVGIHASRGRVTAYMGRKHGTSYYEAPGRVTRDGVKARFGKFGRVSVSFRERRVIRVPSGEFGCRGGPEVVRHGVFVGTIRLRGEGGYTKVTATRARGQTTVVPRWRCRGGSPGFSEAPDQVGLAAVCGRDGFTALGTRSVEQGPRVFPDEDTSTWFLASALERRGRIRIIRLAFARAGRSAFLFDDALTFATVRPPPPFHGVGRLTRDPAAGGTWKGTLSVDFPGRTLNLIAPRYRVGLFRYREEKLAGKYVLQPRVPCPRRHESTAVALGRYRYGAPVIFPGGH